VKRAIAWFAENSVAANLLMVMVIAGGISALPSIPQKTFPDIDIDMVIVSVPYLGASPAEVEEGVCIRIEEEIQGIDGIDQINSTAVEGFCTVVAELLTGADEAQVLDEIKSEVDAIDTFPEETEKPIVAQAALRRPVLDVAISGAADEHTLKALGERVRDEILEIPFITQADLTLVRQPEMSIEVSEESLRRHGLRFDHVANAVRRTSLDLPGGSVKTAGGEILLRTKGQAYRGAEFEDVVVVTRADGTRLLIRDLASVRDGFEDEDLIARFDSDPAVLVSVYRVGGQDVIAISDEMKAYVARAQERMPEGITLTVWQDDSRPLRSRRDTLVRNGRSGFILVLAVLALFLRARVAFWVTLGVPVAFLGGLWAFLPLDLSINVITLFAFIVVLGILVDDAVVVGESIFTRQQRAPNRLQGAIAGAQAVTVPVVFGVLTTVATFTPLMMVPGPMGQIFGTMARVVIACLLFSLVESQLVLPAHLSHGHAKAESGPGSMLQQRWRRVRDLFGNSLENFATQTYLPFLKRVLRWRYTMLAVALAMLMATVGVVKSGRMLFSFFPPIEADYLAARLTLPQGTPIEVTAAAAAQLERSAERMRSELDPEFGPPDGSLVEHVLTTAGAQPFNARQNRIPGQGSGASSGSHVAEVVLQLVRSEDRLLSTREIAQEWRDRTAPIPDAIELTFATDLFSAGEAINVQLEGADVEELRIAANRLKLELAQFPGVFDISDSFRAGKQEVRLRIKASAEPLGVTMQDLARQVRQAFYGEEVQRIQRGRDDVRVMVRYPEWQRRSLGDLENVRIRTPDGAEVPFSTVAHADLGRGYASIRRTDRKRVVNVTADVDRNVTTANDVLAALDAGGLGQILRDHPSVSFSLEGEQREQNRALGGLARAYLIALLAVYALLAIPLRSYLQPLLIMSVIPFGLVGAIGGHYLMGSLRPLMRGELGIGDPWSLSFMSVVGMVALSGVVVNASLVMIHYVNERRAEGAGLVEAVSKAGVARFRPILLTSLTTFAGLTPLMLERSVQAQFLIPMAISVAWGVVFATAITLLVLPCGYIVLDDLARLILRRQEDPS
jgi:multidrug efflux pump subunit AcrB